MSVIERQRIRQFGKPGFRYLTDVNRVQCKCCIVFVDQSLINPNVVSESRQLPVLFYVTFCRRWSVVAVCDHYTPSPILLDYCTWYHLNAGIYLGALAYRLYVKEKITTEARCQIHLDLSICLGRTMRYNGTRVQVLT